MQFETAGTFSEDNLDKLIKASFGLYHISEWKSWCKKVIDSESNENWPIIANLYDKENLVIKVVEVNNYLIFIPQLPVEDLLIECEISGDYEETKAKIAEFYKEVIMLTPERFLAYQDIFNRFVEFMMK